MRIRKHAKISSVAHLKPETIYKTECMLNQNPWDVMSFSPPSSLLPSPSQVSKIDAPEIENYSMDTVVAVEREEFNDGGRKRNHHNLDNNVVDCMTEQMVDKPIGLCGITNRRSRDSKNTNSHRPTKEKQTAEIEATPFAHRPRRNKAFGSSSKASEFCYYSGLGPCWGKNGSTRGETNESELSPMLDEDSDCADPIEDEEMMKNKLVKKRGRKPIKFRSLKSLMK